MTEKVDLTSVEHDGKTYELKMTRAGVRAAEDAGLSTDDMGSKPQTAIVLLFFAALYSRYKMNPNKAAGILDDLLDAGAVEFTPLFTVLAEQYNVLFGLGESE